MRRAALAVGHAAALSLLIGSITAILGRPRGVDFGLTLLALWGLLAVWGLAALVLLPSRRPGLSWPVLLAAAGLIGWALWPGRSGLRPFTLILAADLVMLGALVGLERARGPWPGPTRSAGPSGGAPLSPAAGDTLIPARSAGSAAGAGRARSCA